MNKRTIKITAIKDYGRHHDQYCNTVLMLRKARKIGDTVNNYVLGVLRRMKGSEFCRIMTKNYYRSEYSDKQWKALIDKATELGCQITYSKYGNIVTIDSTDLEIPPRLLSNYLQEPESGLSMSRSVSRE